MYYSLENMGRTAVGLTKRGNSTNWNSMRSKYFLFHTHSLLFGGTLHAVLPTGNHQATKWNWEINIINAFTPQTVTHNTHKNLFACTVEFSDFFFVPADVQRKFHCSFVFTWITLICALGHIEGQCTLFLSDLEKEAFTGFSDHISIDPVSDY